VIAKSPSATANRGNESFYGFSGNPPAPLTGEAWDELDDPLSSFVPDFRTPPSAGFFLAATTTADGSALEYELYNVKNDPDQMLICSMARPTPRAGMGVPAIHRFLTPKCRGIDPEPPTTICHLRLNIPRTMHFLDNTIGLKQTKYLPGTLVVAPWWHMLKRQTRPDSPHKWGERRAATEMPAGSAAASS
jgi:hypothetical protein